jgi:hypothetical protein
MAISWSLRRKMLYSGATMFVALCIVTFVWFKFFNTPPTCFDQKQNGTELGVDCGGACALLCSQQVHDPIVLWARPFPNGTQAYTAAAYIENNNNAGAHSVHYAFQFFDATNKLVLERDGTMEIPPVHIVPVVEPSVYAGNRTIVRALFSFTDLPVWKKIPQDAYPAMRVSKQTLSTDSTRLDATIENTSLIQDAMNVTVVAVLYDADGIARAASKSAVAEVDHQSSVNVVFTWPQPVPNVTRSEVTILPSF